MKTFDIKDIQVGDSVQLRWNGYPGVPGWLHGGWATVERKARTRVAIRARGEAQDGYPPRWVRMDQITAHERDEVSV
jgi:hypothetical protein